MSLVHSHPAHDAYADSVATPIYLSSYSLREEIEDIVRLKIALDVLSEKAPTLLTPEMENFHVSLANFLDSLERFESQSRYLAIDLGFVELQHDKDIFRRHDMPSFSEASFTIHMELKTTPDKIVEIVENQEQIAHALLGLLPQRGEALRDKINDLLSAIGKDVEFMQMVRPSEKLTELNSSSVGLMKRGESLLDQDHLPQVLDLCRRASQSITPALQETVLQGSKLIADSESSLSDKAYGA